MFGKTSLTKTSLSKSSRAFVGLSLVAVISGCSTSSEPTEAITPVVQAYCPQVVIRADAAFHRTYVGKATDDESKLVYQASLADATRSCTANEQTLTINVLAQGRIVQGAAGKTGPVALPMVVEVADGDDVIYSQKVSFTAEIPPEGSGQFIFQKADVSIPNAQGGASRFTRVRIGFDNGATAPRKAGKRG